MTAPVKTARPDTPIADLVLWMTDAGLHHLPVVGADEKLVGIVSQTDLVCELLVDAAERTSLPHTGSRGESKGTRSIAERIPA